MIWDRIFEISLFIFFVALSIFIYSLIKEKKKQTIKYKKNIGSAVKVDSGDSLDYQSELDTDY